MGSCGSPIELDDGVPFIENDWIAQGKKYTKVPAFVRWKKDSYMEIPLNFLRYANFPEPELSVKCWIYEFISFVYSSSFLLSFILSFFCYIITFLLVSRKCCYTSQLHIRVETWVLLFSFYICTHYFVVKFLLGTYIKYTNFISELRLKFLLVSGCENFNRLFGPETHYV